MDIEAIFNRNREWVTQKKEADKNYFKKLSRGQQPEFLYIGCSDSRVVPEEIMGITLGEMFVYRNIANMVSNLDMGIISAVEYAVVYLKVKHIIICGHYRCGGVEAALHTKDMGVLNPWIQNIRDIHRLHWSELEAIQDINKKHDRLVELNVQEQCMNLLKMPAVQMAYKENKISISGLVFDIHEGYLKDLKVG